MDKTQLLALFTRDQRQEATFPDTRREVTPTVTRHIDEASAGEGMITYSQLTAANADEVIEEQIKYYEGIGQDFEWKLYDYDQPPDLKDRLAARGFTIEEVEAIMVLDLDDAPPLLWQPTQHDIQRITAPEKIAEIVAIEQEVWDEDFSGLGHFLREALRSYPDQMSIYVAYVDGQPASAAWIYFPQNSQFASLWGGSTLSRYRKQGLYTALLAVRAQEARERQVKYLTVDASDMSGPILEKYGFQTIAHSYPCKWEVKA